MRRNNINRLLKEKANRFKLNDDLIINEHSGILKEIEDHLNLTDVNLMTSDDNSLQKDIGLKTDIHLLQKTYQEYLCSHLTSYFGGLSFNTEMLNESYRTLLPFIAENRKFSTVQAVPKFLGVIRIVDGDGRERSMNFFLSKKTKVDLIEGYLLGKKYPDTDEVYKIMLEEHLELKSEVYGLSKKTYQLKTIEGDVVDFKNLNEVYCWLISRVENYIPGEKYSW